jgi:hypothetical protein
MCHLKTFENYWVGFERVSDPVVWAVAPPSKEFPLQRVRRARRGWLVVPGVIVGDRDRHGVVVGRSAEESG